MEEIKESKRYKGYFSDRNGRIYSNRRGKIQEKKTRFDKDGYLITNVIDDVKKIETTVRVHRLVAECWIPNPENKPVVNHINNVKNDNRCENLEWATISENTKHAYDGGWAISPKSTTVSIYIDSKLICVYPTVIECSKNLNIDRNTINKNIKTNKKLYDFIEFKCEGLEKTDYLLCIKKSFSNLNPIKDCNNNILYENIRDMSNKTGYTFSTCQYYIKRGYDKNGNKIIKINKKDFLISCNYIK